MVVGGEALTQRRFLLPVFVACTAIVLLVGVLSNFSQDHTFELEDKYRDRGHSIRHRRTNNALVSEENAATAAQKEMLKDGPAVDKTEDDYIAARSHLASIRAKLRDNSVLARHLGLLQKSRAELVKDADNERKAAAVSVSEEEGTLQEARKWGEEARTLELQAAKFRTQSASAESQGISLQKPAAALLKDSQKLNDQSNLVLDQSHSAQAKALAALDLKLAQSLADRASTGMANAKKFFASAINERKQAVTDGEEAAKDVLHGAEVSLKQNAEAPALMQVIHGQLSGADAREGILRADTAALAKREAEMGQAKEAVVDAKAKSASVAEQIAALAQAAKALRKELGDAEKAVVAAAKSHLEASSAYKKATATSLQAQTQVDGLREGEVKELRARLGEAGASRDKASAAYKQALEKVADLNGKQTVLQVHVARLQLQLKEADMQRDDARRKAAQEQQTINSMQAEVDKEDGDLNEARLRLADSSIATSSIPQSPMMGLSGAAVRSTTQGGLHAVASEAEAAAAAAGNPHDVSLALDRQRRADEQLREEEESARQRSHTEEAKLRAAQAEVAKELSRVTGIEGGVH